MKEEVENLIKCKSLKSFSSVKSFPQDAMISSTANSIPPNEEKIDSFMFVSTRPFLDKESAIENMMLEISASIGKIYKDKNISIYWRREPEVDSYKDDFSGGEYYTETDYYRASCRFSIVEE